MAKTHWMVRIVQIAALLFVLLGCLVIFIYSPFYSKLVVKALNTFVPVEVNEVAAKSQKMAALSETENLEPGSNLWIARQAYQIQQNNSENLPQIQARYKALQDLINKEQQEQNEEEERPQVPLLADPKQAASAPEDPTQNVKDLLELDSKENKALMEKYLDFLQTHKIEPVVESVDAQQIQKDIAQIKEQNETPKGTLSQPYAIVVLGLPIVLSGVEAPFMQTWLKERGVDAKLLENRSMNTCENSRFSSLLLQKKGGAPTVILITDQYHMPRTRRLFALNGIETVPIEAPMPTQLTAWQPSQQNYDHSRRANYEMLATIRDMLFGSSDCREVP